MVKTERGKAKVLLTPGTQVEDATLESRVAGEFCGWEARTAHGFKAPREAADQSLNASNP